MGEQYAVILDGKEFASVNDRVIFTSLPMAKTVKQLFDDDYKWRTVVIVRLDFIDA